MSVQPFSVTLFRAPFSCPHLQGAGIRNSGPRPSTRFECCTRQHPRHGGYFGKPFQGGVPELQQGQKAAPPSLTISIFRSNRHLPDMDSANRGFRPVVWVVPFLAEIEYPSGGRDFQNGQRPRFASHCRGGKVGRRAENCNAQALPPPNSRRAELLGCPALSEALAGVRCISKYY